MFRTQFLLRPAAVVPLFMIIVITNAALNAADAKAESTSNQGVNQVIKELTWGKVMFNFQKSLDFKETGTVVLDLSHLIPIDDLIRHLQQKAEKEYPGTTVSNRIEARLEGEGFLIKPLVPQIQAFSSEGLAQWKWDIMPLDGGLKNLEITLSVIMINAHRDMPLMVWNHEQPLNVEITTSQCITKFFSDYYLWLSTAALIVGGIYITRRYHKTRQKD